MKTLGKRNGSVECKCSQCGKTFYRYLSRIKHGRGKNCSKKCLKVSKKGKRMPWLEMPFSEERKRKISERMKGGIPWNKGIPRTQEERKKISEGRIRMEVTPWNKGKSLSAEQMKTVVRGAAHWNWQGGITPKNMKIRASREYRQWRILVFERDGYTCQFCQKIGGRLHADHIKTFSKYPELRFELSNGRTLCKPCHQKTDTYRGSSDKLF